MLDESGYHSGELDDDGNSTSDDESTNSRTQLDEHLHSLKHTMDNLYKMSFLIRNQKSKQSAFGKAELYGINADGKGTDLFGHFNVYDHDRAVNFVRQERLDSGHQEQRESQSIDESLFAILSQASSKRRRQFAYWEQHSMKLATEVSGETSEVSELASRSGRTAISGTEATALPKKTELPEDEAHSVAPSASTAWNLRGDKATFPRAPKQIEGHTEFECPICHIWCQETERRHWR